MILGKLFSDGAVGVGLHWLHVSRGAGHCLLEYTAGSYQPGKITKPYSFLQQHHYVPYTISLLLDASSPNAPWCYYYFIKASRDQEKQAN